MISDKPILPSFDHQPKPYDGPSTEEILSMRKEFLNPALVTYYKKPLTIVEGKMQVNIKPSLNSVFF